MDYLTTPQVAERYGVQIQTVSRWCSQERLPGAFKVGRDWLIPPEALAKFIKPQVGYPKGRPRKIAPDTY